jgi:FKBP-type peptidyl-prolyl cis-trans isomerase FkpA
MRPALAAAFALLALLPAACNKKAADTKAPAGVTTAAAANPASGPGVPGPGYTTSEADTAKFLADYEKLPGVTKTADGLLYRVIKAGNGKTPLKTDDQVTVLYKGQLIDGSIFDQTTPQNPADPDSGPRTFPAGQLIPGWVEALSKMKEGDQWEIVTPYALAYGEEGHPPAIPAKATLVFQMSLIKVDLTP